MLKEQIMPAERSAANQDAVVMRSKALVQKFSSFKDPKLGLTESVNHLERLNTDDPIILASTARLMENFIQKTIKLDQLNETSRDSMPAWIKTGLGLIATTYGQDLTGELISEQPMAQRRAKVHYLDVVSERAKGRITNGAKIFDALSSFQGSEAFSSQTIRNEPIGSTGSSAFAVTLGYSPIIPNTFTATDGTRVVRDDGNGNIVGDVHTGATRTINYITGAVSFTFGPAGGASSAVAATNSVEATYDYNVEAAAELAEYGIQIRSTELEARARALGASWSQQALFDFEADYGIDAEPMLLDIGAKIIAAERFKHVVNTLRNAATGGLVVFDNASPTGVPYLDHIRTFKFALTQAQNLVYQKTQKVRPNRMVIAPNVMHIIEAQEGFKGGSIGNDGTAGPKKFGTLTNHGVDVFVDPTYVQNRALLVFKGGNMLSTAAVLGTYVPLYRAPLFQRGFRKDVAMFSEYAIEVIDRNQIAEIQFTNV